MGQYYLLANLSKREYINPHRLGAPAKLVEIYSNIRVAGVLLAYHQGIQRGLFRPSVCP